MPYQNFGCFSVPFQYLSPCVACFKHFTNTCTCIIQLMLYCIVALVLTFMYYLWSNPIQKGVQQTYHDIYSLITQQHVIKIYQYLLLNFFFYYSAQPRHFYSLFICNVFITICGMAKRLCLFLFYFTLLFSKKCHLCLNYLQNLFILSSNL